MCVGFFRFERGMTSEIEEWAIVGALKYQLSKGWKVEQGNNSINTRDAISEGM
jgi:hypothetical protein